MSKSKKKTIKKLKRIHIWPHLVMMPVFFVLFIVIISLFSEVLVSMVIESHLDDSYTRAEKFASLIEAQNPGDEIQFSVSEWTADDYCVYDNKTDEFVIEPTNEIHINDFITYTFNNRKVYFDSIDDTGSSVLGEDGQLDETAIIRSFFANTSGKAMSNELMNTEVFRVHAWIDQPIKDGRYSVYYGADVSLKVRELVHIGAFILLMVVVGALPMILYIITLIISIVSQTRAVKLLYYDPVTGGKNYLYFKEHTAKIIKKSKPGLSDYAVVSFRMQRYQSYCACYGSDAGEDVVTKINEVIKSSTHKRKEYFARYGEAEFCMFLIMHNKDEIQQRIESIRQKLLEILDARKIDFNAGVCETIPTLSVDEIYSNASIARKSIEGNGDDRICWFEERLKEEQMWERFVEENMEKALNSGELHVYLQPKYNAESRRLGGAEALIRWISPTNGFIGPGKFIPIFEKNGFITKLDDFMLREVAQLQAKWVAEGCNVVPISVNISRAHFTQPDLAEHLCAIVDKAGAPKDLIELELTESAFFEDKDTLINTVEKLKNMGFKVSMDDFGAGYSSLNSLKDLKLDVLKIDADFFRGREENEDRGSLIVAETIRLAKDLGMTTVAEGIESADQVEFLAKNGCDLIQGYYFAKPMPVGDYEKKMEEDANNDGGSTYD